MAGTITESVFSDFEIRKMGIKVEGDETYTACDCVGTCEEELEVLVVTKKCRGLTAKTRVKSTGAGTLTISAHFPYELWTKLYAMSNEGLVEGVQAYGRNSAHKPFSIVMDTFDEDGNEKFRAYPACIMQVGPTRSVENGAEEVAEMEIEIGIMPDDAGNCLYEAMVRDLGTDTKSLRTKWMSEFTPELVQAVEA